MKEFFKYGGIVSLLLRAKEIGGGGGKELRRLRWSFPPPNGEAPEKKITGRFPWNRPPPPYEASEMVLPALLRARRRAFSATAWQGFPAVSAASRGGSRGMVLPPAAAE